MTILVAGTASGCGKNTVACGLLRLMHEASWSPVPVKPLSIEGLPHSAGCEITPSVVLQCQAARTPPRPEMNPVRVIFAEDGSRSFYVNGARQADDGACMAGLAEHIAASLDHLRQYGTLVLEGSGALAETFDSPALLELYGREVSSVVLVADALNGGALVGIVGTLELAPRSWQERIRAVIINRLAGFPWENPIPRWSDLLRDKYGIASVIPMPIVYGLRAISEDEWPMAPEHTREEEICAVAETLGLRAGLDFLKILTS